ncbi:contractile injection system protein, VgrG/Pvc8 family [Citrobacter sp. S2-9]|uniref:Contractile injection system protein, VgrG/Pvc8 family n=1 Tax=Citrobacter enshiensis TaxID=2971264 RepID=A0ABT8PRV9_9ENTR|nr:contractile injection system protein, VgrG/Pvc8 family [Citrobacter enshiensis]MDN8599004.1 contractile injection system protein, VgrG/Pvc8 family [Citrobacter enshiensis]
MGVSDGYVATGAEPWLPNFSISVGDEDITEKVRKGLVNIALTDYGGANKQSDQVVVSVVSESLQVPAHGVTVRIGLGFGTQIIDKGSFVVDGASSGGEPRIVEFTAKAAPMSAERGAGTVQSYKTRSWTGQTIGDILGTIATEQGLTARVSEKFAGQVIEQLDQVGESDANLVTRLAARVDAVSKITGGYWTFLPRGVGESASGKPLKQLVVKRSEISPGWNFVRNSRTGSSGSGSSGGDGTGTFVVKYHDQSTGEIKELRTGTGDPVVEAPVTEPSLAAAEELMPGVQGAAKKKQVSMTIPMVATPERVSLTSECKITTSGFGTAEDRDWTINSLAMTLAEQGFSIRLSLE